MWVNLWRHCYLKKSLKVSHQHLFYQAFCDSYNFQHLQVTVWITHYKLKVKPKRDLTAQCLRV